MLEDARILVTGGTGSFGHAFVAKMLEHNPRRLVIFSRDELKQSQMEQEFHHPSLRFFIGDVRDQSRLELAMRDIDIVVHAAAMKRIEKCEYDPEEAIKTNVFGAMNVVKAALRTDIKRVVALSTDKAVNPINLYGSTKLAAEKLFIASNKLAGSGGCRFSVCRYGNVLGSRGSVVQLFRTLASNDMPLTITDETCTRFWMTIEQAVDFVLQALTDMQGGEIFIPRLPSMRVVDLAEAVAPGHPTKVIGLRPGEKIHEVLLSKDESRWILHRDQMRFTLVPGNGTNPTEFEFRSDTNPWRLTIEELRKLIA